MKLLISLLSLALFLSGCSSDKFISPSQAKETVEQKGIYDTLGKEGIVITAMWVDEEEGFLVIGLDEVDPLITRKVRNTIEGLIGGKTKIEFVKQEITKPL